MMFLANPVRFLRLADILIPWLRWSALLALATGAIWGLFFSPPDYQQGDTVRIMYIHVPAAILSEGVFVLMAVASAVALIWKHPLADLAAKAAAPIGASFTALALITGSLWGQPTWGTWWEWDPRMTSVLVQLFLYLGYMAMWQAFEDPVKAAKASSILAIVGVINVPIIKFSVYWWNSLHQQSSLFAKGGPAIADSMLWPLLIMITAYGLYFGWVFLLRLKAEVLARRVQTKRVRMMGA